jgi:3-oxoacyl-[acyl-carrier protein] reductase
VPRSILITGAGSPKGIGFTAAHLFAEAGDQIFLTGHSDRVHERTKELALAHPGAIIHALAGDLTDPRFSKELIHDLIARHGVLDVLVNNAGMTSEINPAGKESAGLSDISHDAWHASIARNLDSLFYLTKEALPHLRNSRAGRIINITSVTGPVMAMRNEVAYAAAKAAIVGFTRSLALDEAARGITINAIAPGWIATDSQTAHESEQGRATPMQRSGRPEEIASAIFWLASEGAGYMTGQTLVIDGGNSIAEERA